MKKLLFTAVVLLMGTGCAEGNNSDNNSTNNSTNNSSNNTTNNSTNNCNDNCTADQSYCEGNQVMVCETSTSGCMEWAVSRNCETDSLICDIVDGTALCAEHCTDQCTDGQTLCDENTILTCETQANGCLNYTAGTDCSDSSRTCSDTDGSAQCECSGECTSDSCNETVVEICTEDEYGCFHLETGDDCSLSGMICNLTDGVAECALNCTSECTATQQRCNSDTIQNCILQSNGCYSFVDAEDCSDTQRVCSETAQTAMCDCSGECSSDSCNGTNIENCVQDSYGCFHLESGTDCNLSGMICTVSDGEAVCELDCTSECTIGEERCNGNTAQDCVLQSSGCYSFTDMENCSDGGRLCNDTSGTAICECQSECVSSTQQCQSNVIENCTADSWGCYFWTTGTNCSLTSQICTTSGTSASCEDPSGPVTLISEDFSSWVPAGWSIYDGGTTADTWQQCDGCDVVSNFTISTDQVAYVNSDVAGMYEDCLEYLITPLVSTLGYTTVTLEFDHYFHIYEGSTAAVDISVNGGSTWTEFTTWTSDTYNVHETLNISSLTANQSQVQIRFRYEASWEWYWMIDNVTVTAQ
ncbi:MAG: choice-of-anchor J domain-containing protein [Deltaproteobacteria bacterium]|nr:choice-of-anchor J domain-containing protein [Deltaproteobacteria bacterium]